MSDKRKLTTNAVCPVFDSRNVLAAGPRGPQRLQDVWFLKRLVNLDCEAIPERHISAKLSGACGTFTVTHDFQKYTHAKVFTRVGIKTTDIKLLSLRYQQSI